MPRLVKAPKKSKPDPALIKAELDQMLQLAINAKTTKDLSTVVAYILTRLGAES